MTKRSGIIFLIVLLFGVLNIFPYSTNLLAVKHAKAEISSKTTNSWSFESASSFNIVNSDKIKFFGGSVKIIPTGEANGGYKIWHDTNFVGHDGNSYVFALETDSSGNYYLGGNTCTDGTVTECYAFIVKLDSSFNQVWYKRYFNGFDNVTYGPTFYPPDGAWPGAGNVNSDTGFDKIIFSPSGEMVAVGLGIITNPADTAQIHVMRINPENGDVIWEKIRDKPYPWISAYDDSNGPAFDRQGNFFIDYAVGCGPNYKAGPVEIAKYDINGNELWSKVDDPVVGRSDCQDRPMQEDNFQSVVDSEGSYYYASSYWAAGGWVMNYMLTKYDKDGNFVWRDTKFMDGGGWASPRGLSIDSNDHLYIHGNTSVGAWTCGMRVLDKDGSVIVDKKLMTDIPLFNYCEDSTFDGFDRLALPAAKDDNWKIVNVGFYDTSLNYHGKNTFNITEASGGIGAIAKSIVNRYGDILNLFDAVPDSRYSGNNSAVVAKNTSTFPDTRPSSGVANIISLSNKTGQAYNTLNNFYVTYGQADQADVQFQISNNGSDWYFWNGSDWVKTTGYDMNTQADINTNISKFSDKFGSGNFFFKAFMLTAGTKQVDLLSVSLSHDVPVAVATPTATAAILPETGTDQFLSRIFFSNPLSVPLRPVLR